MMRKIKKSIRRFLSKKFLAGAVLATLLFTGNPAVEAFPVEQLYLEVNQNYHLYPKSEDQTIIRVAVTNPAIADVRVIDDSNVNIVGYKGGSTALTVWYSDGTMEDYNIVVAPTDGGFTELIRRVMNVRGVKIEKVEDRILLRGSVENQYQMNQAQKVAEMFVDKDHVINLLKMTKPIQINLAALVIDISSSDAKEFGFSYANSSVDTNNSGTVSVSDITFGTIGTFYGGQNYHDISGKVMAPVDVMIRALVTNGKAEILSRPNITTMSGEKANILIGGEIPVPTSKDGEISIEWREYGIKLNIEPTADDENNIMAKVNAEISTLDYAHQIATSAGKIPALTSRKAGTCVSLKSGTALAIGGLLNSEDAKTETKIPLLGDIPVIGQFFRHTSNSKEKREMMILLIPTIVDASTPVSATEKMAGVLNRRKLEKEAMPQVDVNAPPERPKPKAKEAESEEQQESVSENKISSDRSTSSLHNRLHAILHADSQGESVLPQEKKVQPQEQPQTELKQSKNMQEDSSQERPKSSLQERLKNILQSNQQTDQTAGEENSRSAGAKEKAQADKQISKPAESQTSQPERQPVRLAARPQDRVLGHQPVSPSEDLPAAPQTGETAKPQGSKQDGQQVNSKENQPNHLPASPKERVRPNPYLEYQRYLQTLESSK